MISEINPIFTDYASLDIEFAITEDIGQPIDTIILQVRPIAAHKEQKKVAAADVEAELHAIAEFIRSDQCIKEPLCGTETAYGVMPDWNPAEIIGINPRPLALSLYRKIITDRVWGISRESCGYRKTAPRPGLVSFSGKPYIDIRMSFSSFTPAALDDENSNQLVEFAIQKLKAHPELHDKVEFEVMPTVFDLNFKSKLQELGRAGFSKQSLAAIGDSYHTLTKSLMNQERVESELLKYAELTRRREKLLLRLTPDQGSRIETIQGLLRDCQEFGTLPFSNLARLAFVGVIQLKSLMNRGVLSHSRYSDFLADIHTVAKQFVDDLTNLPRPELIRAYGHLRPGTYDITSPAYHEAFDRYLDLENRPRRESHATFSLTGEEHKNMALALDAAGFEIEPESLLDFIRAAIQGRELGKFEFSRNLSLAIDFITELGDEYGFNRDEISFLNIEHILDLGSKSIPANLVSQWRDLINMHRRQHAVSCAIKLPELITCERDIWSFALGTTKPNFITQNTIVGTTVDVSSSISTGLNGAICLIENADPGFDWIFSHPIAGLITAYGGANSHMAIRCAEFEVPAAIGCGGSLYQSLLSSNRVRLDCAGMTIEVLS
ncbi:MAG: PEP-utilizing enzyme [Pirellulaceae bacterium]|nr:PEP-utilizing enzyme [Pirellulaceae bacterium]